jgi:multiple antibiotic resistance protein
MQIADYLRFVVSLIAILAPFATIPIFLTLTEGQSHAQRIRTARMAVATVFAVLAIAGLTGEAILEGIGTSLAAFRVGGGLIVLLMAISMLNARLSGVQHTEEESFEAASRTEVGVVPLGIPLMAGPGSISSVIIEIGRAPDLPSKAGVVACIAIVCLALLAALQLAVPIGTRLGKTGLNILNRLFGLLLAAIAVQTIAAGLKALFPALG